MQEKVKSFVNIGGLHPSFQKFRSITCTESQRVIERGREKAGEKGRERERESDTFLLYISYIAST